MDSVTNLVVVVLEGVNAGSLGKVPDLDGVIRGRRHEVLLVGGEVHTQHPRSMARQSTCQGTVLAVRRQPIFTTLGFCE